jgi:hypothetical protein
MEKFLSNDNLDKWDYWTIAIYLLITLVIFNPELINYNLDFYLCYSIFTLLFLYMINYKSLRKLKVFIIWGIIAIGHLFLYFKLRNEVWLQIARGSAVKDLKLTWVALLLIQFFRFLSLIIFKTELVCPSRSKTDLWDNKPNTWQDFVFLLLYGVIIFSFD